MYWRRGVRISGTTILLWTWRMTCRRIFKTNSCTLSAYGTSSSLSRLLWCRSARVRSCERCTSNAAVYAVLQKLFARARRPTSKLREIQRPHRGKTGFTWQIVHKPTLGSLIKLAASKNWVWRHHELLPAVWRLTRCSNRQASHLHSRWYFFS